jgi:hypothetical protein
VRIALFKYQDKGHSARKHKSRPDEKINLGGLPQKEKKARNTELEKDGEEEMVSGYRQ